MSEEYVIRQAVQAIAPALFQQAVREQWPYKRCRDEVRLLKLDPIKQREVRGYTVPAEDSKGVLDLHGLARKSAPRDLLDLILQLIGACREPLQVIDALPSRLVELRRQTIQQRLIA